MYPQFDTDNILINSKMPVIILSASLREINE